MTNFELLKDGGEAFQFLYDLRIIKHYYDIPLIFDSYNRYGFYCENYYSKSYINHISESKCIESFIQSAIKWLLEDSKQQTELKQKCSYPDGLVIKPDGVHELDPCRYEEIETVYNVNVRVLRCKECGHIELEWFRNED